MCTGCVRRVQIWTLRIQKWQQYGPFFWPSGEPVNAVKTLILIAKKTPFFRNLQKSANFDKIFDNFWQFFANFFFKKNKKLKKIYYKLFFFRHNLRENKSEICQNFLLTHRYVHDKNLSKKLSKICQICTFLSHYVYTFVYTWKTLFFCLNFGPFWTFLSHCVQGVYGHFFHKNFYHFFIFYFFTKFYFSLISRWKFEKTSICTTIW